MGNIGEPVHTREFEPISVPIQEPVVAPLVPESVPA